jgi:rRNA-processing protein FCF1
MQHVFLDTNILIHFIHFEQIDWHEALQTADSIKIVFAPIVIAELDKHKYSSKRKLSNRAKRILPFLEKIMLEPGFSKYESHFIHKKPAQETFTNNALDLNDSDDKLLATILEYKATLAERDNITYVTNDVGPRLKSISLGISVLKPEEIYLSNEPDELEQENNELKKQLSELKNRMPDIKFSFSEGQTVLEVQPPKKLKSKDEFIEQQIKKIQEKYPPYKTNDPYQNTLAAMVSFPLSESQRIDYNESLIEFYEEYIVYLDSFYKLERCKNNSIKIQFLIQNLGSQPAENIDIDLHFPDGFDLIEEDDLPELKSEPNPPYKPKHALDIRMPSLTNFSGIVDQMYNPSKGNNFTKSGPTIKRTNSYDVNFHLKILKHHHNELLDVVYAKFEDISAAKGFGIDYRITAANIPKPVIGQLHVKFSE